MASICTNCATPLEVGTKFCGTCGSAVDAPTRLPQGTASPSTLGSTATRNRRYPALRIIALLVKILAVLTAIGGVITGLSAATLTSALQNYPGSAGQGIAAAGTAIGWIIFLASLCYALFLWASAEMIHVLLDIEENTRRGTALAG